MKITLAAVEESQSDLEGQHSPGKVLLVEEDCKDGHEEDT